MSLITQCPACATMFKVVPDQLRVSEGWVRCGQCDEVFDANAQLQASPHTPAAEPIPPPIAAAEPEGYDWGAVTGQPTAAHQVTQPQTPPDVAQPLSVAAPLSVSNEALDAETNLADPFLEKSPHELLAFQGSAPVDLEVDIDLAVDGEPRANAQPLVAPDAVPSFLADKPRLLHGKNRISTGALFLGCLTLVLVLSFQVLQHERDRIAATQPALAPLLASACAVAGCEIAAYRLIDAVVIDSSSFAKAGAQTYKLQFTVKNVAHLAVATPALELTLTDTQDRALVRRVVKPEEFGSRKGTLDAGDEFSATLPIQVRLAKNADKIAGYRLLAFYP
jgi:predicted Zn finger-like uncharacterized protein